MCIAGNVISFTTPVSSIEEYTTFYGAKLTKVNFVENLVFTGLKIAGRNVPGTGERGLSLSYVNKLHVSNCEFINQDTYQCEL